MKIQTSLKLLRQRLLRIKKWGGGGRNTSAGSSKFGQVTDDRQFKSL